MKQQGRKVTKTRVPGHQDCAVCHPETKGAKAKERRAWRKAVREEP